MTKYTLPEYLMYINLMHLSRKAQENTYAH